MQRLADDLWIVDGDTVTFHGFPYSTRMTVVRLDNGQLWLHSPIRLTTSLQAQLNALGPVAHLVAPNHLHHLFLADWAEACPDARVYGTRQVIDKRPDVHFDETLGEHPPQAWARQIDQVLFDGSRLMSEAVFFHRASRTLIVADLIENFPEGHFNWWQRPVARLAGILAPHGKTPLDWRLSFNKHKAQAALAHIKAWAPTRIVMAHGEVVAEKDNQFLNESFDWLQ
ncbi:DUF4336 domain-containing protein [Marinobacter sp. JSM 1782161]|uniref:DUF4336 domain-containing protein n=1 Tax=Marinobacter sp. JSM 1782161 TaxID=2685906 RepID=UPI001401CEF6|nr:DUF4336 domain-containing protein [Marinobacter sp. JSM 1782161]